MDILNLFIMPLLPEICILISGLAVLLTGLYTKKRWVLTAISCLGIALAAFFTFTVLNGYCQVGYDIAGVLSGDVITFRFTVLFLFIALMVILGSQDYAKQFENVFPEYIFLIHLALIGMMLLISAQDMIATFASLELMALSFYALTGLMRNKKSAEAALKYILLGSINSAILLFGMSLLFGFTGQTAYDLVGRTLAEGGVFSLGLLLAGAMIITGFSFKIAAVPFHMWAPEVYDGSPTSVTLLLSTGSKLAGFGALYRIVVTLFGYSNELLYKAGIVFAALSVLSMFAGNLAAIPQKNIKKMLAFSGICQSGYMLFPVVSIGLNYEYASSMAYGLFMCLFTFAVAFALAEIAAFTGIMTVSKTTGSDEIESFKGLGKKSPFIAIVITIALLSLMGLPATAGFIGKFTVFSSIGSIFMIIMGVLNSVISAVYYLRVIKTMWTGESEIEGEIKYSVFPMLVMMLCGLLVIFVGIFGTNIF